MEKYINKYLNILKAEKKSKATLRTTRIEIARFIREVGIDADTDLIAEYYEELSPQTINKKNVILRGFFGFLKNEGVIEENVFERIKSPRRRVRIPQYLETDEYLKVKNAIRSLPDDFPNALISGIFGVLYAGLRFAEILSLTINDVDLNFRQLKVTGKRDKQRMVEIGQFTTDMLTKWFKYRNCHRKELFIHHYGKPLKAKALRNLITKTTVEILGRKVTAHCFRHSYCTHLVRESGRIDIVKELAGHERIETTLIYTHLLSEDRRKIINTSQTLS